MLRGTPRSNERRANRIPTRRRRRRARRRQPRSAAAHDPPTPLGGQRAVRGSDGRFGTRGRHRATLFAFEEVVAPRGLRHCRRRRGHRATRCDTGCKGQSTRRMQRVGRTRCHARRASRRWWAGACRRGHWRSVCWILYVVPLHTRRDQRGTLSQHTRALGARVAICGAAVACCMLLYSPLLRNCAASTGHRAVSLWSGAGC